MIIFVNESQPLITKGHGLGISEFYTTVKYQMGSTAMKGIEKILEALKAKDIKGLEDVNVTRDIGRKVMR